MKLEGFPGYPMAGLPRALQTWTAQQRAVATAKADAARSKLDALPNGNVTHVWRPRPTVRASWSKVVAPPLPTVRPAAGKVFQQHHSNMAHEVQGQRHVRPKLHPLARAPRARWVVGRV